MQTMQAQQSPVRDPPSSSYDKGNSWSDGASPQHEPRPRPSPSTEMTFIPVTAEVCTLSLRVSLPFFPFSCNVQREEVPL